MSLKKSKPLLYITYAIVLAFVLFNYKQVYKLVISALSLATPFYIALVIAFLLNIPMKKIEKLLSKKIQKKKQLRIVSLTLTIILAILVIALISSFIIPRLIESITLIIYNFVRYVNSLIASINTILQRMNVDYSIDSNTVQKIVNSNFDISKIISNLPNTVSKSGLNIIIQSIGIMNTFINGISSFIMAIYLLASKETYIVQLKKIITYFFGYKKSLNIFDIGLEANHYFNNFVSGQLLEMTILMILLYITFRIFGIPFPELISLIIAIGGFIPIFGTFAGFTICFILILAVSPNLTILYVILFVCVQQFEGNVIYPHVVGDAVGISGLYVLLSLIVFGNLFGFVGMIIAVPSMALIYAVGSRFINIGLYRRRIDVKYGKVTKIKEDE